MEHLSHPDRQRYCANLGLRAAAGDAAARSEVDALLAHPEAWRRWLGTLALGVAQDSAGLLAATRDPSRLVRGRAWKLLCRVGRAEDLAQALRAEADTRHAPRLAGVALLKRPHPALEALVVELAHPDRPDWLERLPLCSEAAVRAALPMLDEHGSISAWTRLAGHHPRLITEALVPAGVVTPRHHWRIGAVLPTVVEADPDAALDLVEALFNVEGQAHAIRSSLVRLAALRPERTFDLIRARQAMGLPAPLAGLFSLVSFRDAHRLGLERLRFAVERAPACLPEGRQGRAWLGRLPADDRRALVAHWVARGAASWGAFLLAYTAEVSAEDRERAWHRWSVAARDKNGCIALHRLHDLPRDLREREARRHLTELPWLTSRPQERRVYASLLPYAEAEAALEPWLRHPEGEERAAALALLLSTVRHDREAAARALAATRRRRNEQDPVRLAMLGALAALPAPRFPAELLPELSAVVTEALDAADLSGATARAAQLLAARVVAGDPERGMELVGKVLQVRGSVDGHALGGPLRVEDARRLDPVLARITTAWVLHERAGAVLQLAMGLGTRLRHMPATLTAVDGLCGMPHLPVLALLLDLLRRHDPRRFEARALALYAADRSAACLTAIAELLATKHTDRLDPLLGGAPIQGRWATGRTHWVLDFGLRLGGWSPAQQGRYGAQLRALLDDPLRDVPTCRWAIERLAVLRLVPASELTRYASDPRQPIRDIALRALPALDGGEALEVLLACMGDDRARIAAYALRRCLQELPRPEVLRRLAGVPLERVTVAKEVLRLMGELGGAAARDPLISIGQRPLHRDVRIALLRALWDHIEHPPAWALLEAAARDPDPILAGRLLSIPMNRLSRSADARLCALFAEVLSRPQPEARLGFLSVVAAAPVRDESRALFSALVAHLSTPDPSEAGHALTAVLARMQPGEVPTVAARLAALLPRRPHAHALLGQLTGALHRWSPLHHRALGTALLPALEADRLAAALAIPLLARVNDDEGFAAGLERLSRRGHLHQDAIAAAMAAVDTFPSVDRLAERLTRATDPRLRRVGPAAAGVDAGAAGAAGAAAAGSRGGGGSGGGVGVFAAGVRRRRLLSPTQSAAPTVPLAHPWGRSPARRSGTAGEPTVLPLPCHDCSRSTSVLGGRTAGASCL